MSWISAAALDGLLGALIGGGVTAGTVVWSMRRQARAGDVEAAVVAVTRLQAACGGLGLMASARRLTAREARSGYDRVLTAAMEARARLQYRWPEDAKTLDDALEMLAAAGEGPARGAPQRATAACKQIITICRIWLEMPDHR